MLEIKKSISALQAAEQFFSEATQFIQMSYDKRPFQRAETAPFYHNFINVYILLNTKQRPEMERGIERLTHLLSFQVSSEEFGVNFPRYLHQYPCCERSFEILDILVPLTKIFQDFRQVLPKDVKSQIESVMTKVMSSLIVWIKANSASYLLQMQMGALLLANGKLLNQEVWSKTGQDLLIRMLSQGPHKTWGSARHLSKIILYLGLVLEEMNSFYLNVFWNYLDQSWHPTLNIYQGASLNEHYYKDLPEITLYHVFMSGHSEEMLSLLFEADLMESALLPKEKPLVDFKPLAAIAYDMQPFKVHQHSQENLSVSYFNLNKVDWEKRGGFYPLRITMRGENTLDHFALEMGSYCNIQQISENQFELVFEPEEFLDVSFYVNLSSNVHITSDMQKATMFNLGSVIELQFNRYKVTLEVHSEGKEGMWAQLLYNNRRSQMIKEFNKTYDAQLYLRQVKAPLEQAFRVLLTIHEV